MSDDAESEMDASLSESLAATNLAELLDRLARAKGEQPLHPDLRVSISFVGVNKAQQPSESLRQFVNSKVRHMLPDLRTAWIAYLQGSVDIARQNLAEIQARARKA